MKCRILSVYFSKKENGNHPRILRKTIKSHDNIYDMIKNASTPTVLDRSINLKTLSNYFAPKTAKSLTSNFTMIDLVFILLVKGYISLRIRAITAVIFILINRIKRTSSVENLLHLFSKN